MLKSLYLVIVLVTLCISEVRADPNVEDVFVPVETTTHGHRGDFYAGISLDQDVGTWQLTNTNTQVHNLANAVLLQFTNKRLQGLTGAMAGAYLGYGWILQGQYFFGFEAFGQFGKIKGNSSLQAIDAVTSDGGSITSQWQAKNLMGISMIPGVKMTDNTMFYFRLGLVGSKMSLSESASVLLSGQIFPVRNFLPFTTHSVSDFKAGGQIGIGFETLFSSNLGLRLEYDYIRLANLNDEIVDSQNFSVLGGFTLTETNQLTIHPAINVFTLGLTYHFFDAITPLPELTAYVSGWYLGAELGVGSGNFSTNQTINWFAPAGSPVILASVSNNEDRGSLGAMGGLYTGYGWLPGEIIYFGGELFAEGGVVGGKKTFTVSALGKSAELNKIQYGQTANVGLSFIPGFKIGSTTLLYGRVGIEEGLFQFKNTRNKIALATFNFLSSNNTNFSKFSSGLQLGLGIETMVSKSMSIRGEYDWNRYQQITNTHTTKSVTLLNLSEVNTFTSKPTINQYKIGFTYHF